MGEGLCGGAESLIQGKLKSHLLPARILAEVGSMTHSGMLCRLDISSFCFYEPLLFQIFVPWKFTKTEAFPCPLLLLQSTTTQITISMNIFICYIQFKSVFLLKYMVKSVIFKFNLNVKHRSNFFS